jgi:Dockerin type I domain
MIGWALSSGGIAQALIPTATPATPLPASAVQPTATPAHTLTPRVVDLSAFREFQFRRDPGLGFCPPLPHAVFAVSLRRVDVGRYELHPCVLEEGRVGIDNCLSGVFSVPCAVVREQPGRILTEAEVRQVQQAFSRVSVFDVPDPICEDIAIDPCLINVARWDDFQVTDYVCTSSERLQAEQMAAIIALLERVRPRPDQCTGDCDGNGGVNIGDLVMLVNTALGTAPLSQCALGDANSDGAITIEEIIAAVDFALHGCAPFCGDRAVNQPGEQCDPPGSICGGGCDPVTHICVDVECTDDCTCPSLP